jgi:SM-20-related protein
MELAAIATELGDAGRCIVPNFLAPNLQAELRTDVDNAISDGRFARAGTGRSSRHAVHDDVRRDDVYWPDRDNANPAQMGLWQQTDNLMRAFNRTLYLGLSHFEGHYAAYPAGGFYRRHRDCFAGDDTRVVSLILYLNRDWQRSDGGALRLHENDSYIDIEPRGGTLVCFLSRELEHEVLESHTARFSFAGWFKVRSSPPMG